MNARGELNWTQGLVTFVKIQKKCLIIILFLVNIISQFFVFSNLPNPQYFILPFFNIKPPYYQNISTNLRTGN